MSIPPPIATVELHQSLHNHDSQQPREKHASKPTALPFCPSTTSLVSLFVVLTIHRTWTESCPATCPPPWHRSCWGPNDTQFARPKSVSRLLGLQEKVTPSHRQDSFLRQHPPRVRLALSSSGSRSSYPTASTSIWKHSSGHTSIVARSIAQSAMPRRRGPKATRRTRKKPVRAKRLSVRFLPSSQRPPAYLTLLRRTHPQKACLTWGRDPLPLPPTRSTVLFHRNRVC